MVIDDCSRDRTLEIARRYAKKYPGTFQVTRCDWNTGYGNFLCDKTLPVAQAASSTSRSLVFGTAAVRVEIRVFEKRKEASANSH